MPASYAAALAAALLAITWLLGRRRAPLVRDVDTSAVAALNRAQIALVKAGGLDRSTTTLPGLNPPASQGGGESLIASAPDPGDWPVSARALGLRPPGRDARQRERFNRDVRAGYRRGGQARLAAIQAARHWGDRSTLPLLRQALRDPDPAVMREAAAAMDRYRGRPSPGPTNRVQPRPRSVARTR